MVDQIKQICDDVSKELVKLRDEKNIDTNENSESSRNLIFPYYKNNGTENKKRVSEQESRVLFCYEIERKYPEFYYSVETPTKQNYSFADKQEVFKDKSNGQSASTDMSIYLCDHKIKAKLNIEFKAHNVAAKNITKDLLKLVAEPDHGLFFHTVESINNGTLTNNNGKSGIIDKYRKINDFKKEWEKTGRSDKYILFAICIIEQRKLLLKEFRYRSFDDSKFFNINYDVVSKSMKVKNNNHWNIIDL